MATAYEAARRAQQSLVVDTERAEAVTRVAADAWLRWSVEGAPVPVEVLGSPLGDWRPARCPRRRWCVRRGRSRRTTGRA
ncbi:MULTISPECIES: hypothetical protein [unclassified Streptomyces]|uniref:hypothetical protein n=1 Tax=unclassified Streptomyces TaxID=2593676 RepID=UPI002DDBC858|nr:MULTISPECIES: hypothetical protein [unclassified Streptomyces]WSA90154.1 hypothetical protein OIE63_00375 [Streptomyces sp. NBC_01795]WSS17235.1 hypothetical protein OG533_39025 [Streptomyces sp. NBC_01186]WSS45979.1 hypothetical protein OG220_39275 [Streptomyces sp. NBC_01187]